MLKAEVTGTLWHLSSLRRLCAALLVVALLTVGLVGLGQAQGEPQASEVRYTAVADIYAQGNGDLALTSLRTPESVAVYPQFRSDHYNYRLVVPEDMTELVITGRFTTPYRNTGDGKTAYVVVAEDLAQAETDWNDQSKRIDAGPGGSSRPPYLVSTLHNQDYARPETISLKAGEPTTAHIGIYKWKDSYFHSTFPRDTYKQVYTLTVTRGLPDDDDATLHDLTVSAGTLDFSPDTTAYTVDVPYIADSVTLTAVPFHPNAAVTVNGGDPSAPVALDYNAPNAVNVAVTAPDGVATRTYALTVNRTFPVRPGQSGDLRLTVQADSITVTWQGPGDGDPPDYYIARIEDADDDATDQRLDADARSATFDSLESGATYTVSVRSGNDGGESDWSQSVTVVTGASLLDSGCQPESGDDYDADDDGLIDVCSLAQLNAIRFDLDGDGRVAGSTIPNAGSLYEAAFPGSTVNGTGCPQSGCVGYELTADLDFDTNGNGRADAGDYGDTVNGIYVNDGNGWTSIGAYAAIFEGNGRSIRNLYMRIRTTQRPAYSDGRGLFNQLAKNGVIRNLTLEKVDVDGNGHRVGALVGLNHGAISKAGASGSVSGGYWTGGLVGRNHGTITDSYSSGEVSSVGDFVGGLVGLNSGGRIERSYSTADVTGTVDDADYYGGLLGFSTYRRTDSNGVIQASVLGSYATGDVSGKVRTMGGLVGKNGGEIFASYATGDVSGKISVGGLVGSNEGPISASFALGAVSGQGNVGGLVGYHTGVTVYATINGQRCVGCQLPNVRPGQADTRSDITASYWNPSAPGQTATTGIHLGLNSAFHPIAARQTAAELRQPTDYTGIYVYWDNLRDNSGGSQAWDFGTSEDFPVLLNTGPSVAAQRAGMPAPEDDVDPPPANRPATDGIDYDYDDDGLIEVRNLDQFDAIRYDMNGKGWGSWHGYNWAYPDAMPGMGCPRGVCIGYELVTDLDFDTNGNGKTDPGDHYWNGVHLLDGSEECQSWYRGGPTNGVKCDDYFGNDGEGWRPLGRNMVNDWYGVFEGNGHTIRNMYINTLDTPFTEEVLNRKDIYGLPTQAGDGRHNNAGLFRTIAGDGVVRNLRLENVNVRGKNFVGALAGENNGIISNVQVTGAVTGIKSVGGLVGITQWSSYITGSSSQAKVTKKPAASGNAPPVPNRAPTVSGSLDDVTVASKGGTKDVSLSGLFDDADGDSLTVTAHTLTITAEPPPDHDGSSYIEVVTASVSADYSTLTLTGQAVGTATVTVTASDGRGGAASADFVATVEAGTPQEQETSGDNTALIAKMKEWRNDPQWVSEKAHTDRWDRALLAFGETVADTTLTAMTAAEAQAFADRGSAWSRWVEVAAALREIEAAGQQQQGTPNRAPTVSAAIGDLTIVSESGTRTVSLSGVFADADSDALTVTAGSSNEAVATASVSSDGSSLTVTAKSRGTATVTVTADDSNGGTADDAFTVTVKASPVVASALADVSGLEAGATREVSLTGAFSDADGDSLTITAASSDETKATVTVAADGSSLTIAGVAEGTATVTVTAQDSDGNSVSDAFEVEVAKRYAALIAQMYEWREDPQWRHRKSHTDRWDRALLAFGETVADTTLTAMTAAEAQSWADSGLSRWVDVAAALWEIEGGGQQQTNQAPTVSAAIADATIVSQSGTKQVSLSGVFSDADNDSLTVTAASSDDTVATVSVASDGSSLTVSAQSRGTATITVTADDGNGGTVDDSFTVTVKSAPVVASALADVSGLEAGSTQEVSLSGVFTDADNDSLTVTAASSDETKVSVSVASDGSSLTLAGVAEGTATITVTAQDTDGNRVSDAFDVSVAARQRQPTPNRAPTVSAAIADATIVNQSGTKQMSLSGVFADADNDSLTVTAGSSNEAVATASVSSDGSSLTVTAKSRGTATMTVTASDGNGGTVKDTFTVTVKAAPVVASAIADLSGLEAGDTRDVSLSGVFSDADSDPLTVTASSDDDAVATVSVAADHSALIISAVSEGTATITVTAQDSDGNRVSDAFGVSVSVAPEPDPAPTPTPTPEPTPTPTPTPEPEPETSDIVARYDANGNGKIDLSELQQAFSDYAAGKITYEEMMEVSNAYARQGSG